MSAVLDDRPAVLLVDDRKQNLIALEAVLEPLPCRLVSVISGEEALKALLNEEFAVVLLDVQMPGMDGFETAELIKRRERTRSVPIIFVTAINKERDHVFRGYSAGAVDYVFKPYDPNVLRSKVARLPRAGREVARGRAERGRAAGRLRRRADRQGAASTSTGASPRSTGRSPACSATSRRT